LCARTPGKDVIGQEELEAADGRRQATAAHFREAKLRRYLSRGVRRGHDTGRPGQKQKQKKKAKKGRQAWEGLSEERHRKSSAKKKNKKIEREREREREKIKM
jgi:hypothetical protein